MAATTIPSQDTIPPATNFNHLTLNSTLADLVSHHFQVPPQTVGGAVAEHLEAYPDLPGVIIIDRSQLQGAFSRRKFLEQVGQHYGVAVYFSRPISVMLKAIAPKYLLLPSTCPIHRAAAEALRRPSDEAYEPIVVEYPDHTFRLLDIYILLLAQSHLLALTHQQEQNRRQLVESLHKIGQRLSSSLDLSKVLRRILKELRKLVPFERGAVFLQKGDYLELVAERGFEAKEQARNLQIPIQSSNTDIFQRLVKTRQPVLIGDVTVDPDWQQMDWLPVDRSWLGLPLMTRDQIIGMVSLTRQTPHAFNADDVSWGQAFASQAAIALENARLYHKLRQFNDQLEQMVAARTQELSQAYAILEKLDQTKSDFIQVAAHELRTPLTIIKGFTQVLSTNPSLAQAADAHEMIAGILSGVERLHQVVNSMLDVTKIASGSLDVYKEKFKLTDLIAKIQGRYAADLAERHLTLIVKRVDTLPPLNGDPDLLAKTLQVLLVNAIKYTPDGGTITIEGQVVPVEAETFVEIKVQDTGIGIDPKHHHLIFEKFYQTGELALHSSGHTSFKGGGPGLGLAIAKGIIEAHEGQIWVESPGYDEATCPGSCFYVRLPLYPQTPA